VFSVWLRVPVLRGGRLRDLLSSFLLTALKAAEVPYGTLDLMVLKTLESLGPLLE
jgi:hypothetical protein